MCVVVVEVGGYVVFLPPGTKPWGQTGKGVVRNKWMKGQREEEEQDSACHK